MPTLAITNGKICNLSILKMPYISRFQFLPDLNNPRFRQLSLEEYKAARGNSEKPIKNREGIVELASDLAKQRVKNLSIQHSARDENIRRAILGTNTRAFTLQAGQAIKLIGYHWGKGSPVASTGTSQLNTLCMTDEMDPCIAVAVAGENIQDGVPSKGAKVRVFHVYPRNVNAAQDIERYVKKLQGAGLTVRVAMHGGDAGLKASRTVAESLRELFAGEDMKNVRVNFDEMCETREGKNTPLGVVIRDDHSVQFVTALFQAAA